MILKIQERNSVLLKSGFGKAKQFLPLALALLICAIFIGYLIITNKLADFYVGDEFLIFYYAELYNHFDAVIHFFADHGRIIEGIFWVYLYEVLGYAPAEMHFVAICLHFIGVALAAISFIRIWPVHRSRSTVMFLMVLLLFFNHKLLVWTFRSSGDNSRITIILFFLAVLFAQQWAATKFKAYWLVLCFASFLLSLFTYESAMLLFPAIVLLAWPMIPEMADAIKKGTIRKMTMAALLGSSLSLLPLIFYRLLNGVYGYDYVATTHPLRGITITRVIERIWDGTILTMRYFLFTGEYNVFDSHWEENVITGIIFLVLVSSIILIYVLLMRFRQGTANQFVELKALLVSLASLWMLFAGLFTFGMYGLEPIAVRGFTLAIFSIPVLVLLLFSLSPIRILRVIWLGASVVLLLGGLNGYLQYTAAYLKTEAFYNNHELSLIQIIPGVKSGTTFIQIDDITHASGCGPSKMMLYGTEVRCAFLTHDTPEADYKTRGERNPGSLYIHRGEFTIKDENWILLGSRSDGTFYIISEVSPESNLLLEWRDESPIITDYNRIVTWETPSSKMYFHLLERREVLDLQIEK